MPRTYRGYTYRIWELEYFREFKRQGVIPRQARPQRYCVWIDFDHHVSLWKETRPGYEMEIACMITRTN